jgi:uncharacterized protein involved in exopolysaccharide biosynthesis
MKKNIFPNNKSYPLNDFSLADLMLGFARQVKIILIFPFILVLIVTSYVFFLARPVYISESKIMSSSKGGGISQAAGLAAQFGIGIPKMQSEQKWVYPELIRSRMLSKAVLKQKFDTDNLGLQKSLLQILTNGNNKSRTSLQTLESTAVESLLRMVSLSEDKLTGVLTLRVKAKHPNLASDINNALIEQLDSHLKNYNKLKTSEARRFIEERISETEKELENVEDDLKNFRDRNRRIGNSPALQLEQQRYEREVTVLTGVFTTLKQQLETTKIEEVKESEYVMILDPPNVPLKPSKPRKMLSVLLAGIFGVGLGLILAFVRELSSLVVKEEKDKMYKARKIFFDNIFYSKH